MHSTNGTTNDAAIVPQRLLTLPEAARYLGCKLWSVRELIWKGQLPYTRFGKRFQVDVRDLDELVEREKRCEGSGDLSHPSASRPGKPVITSPSNGRQHVGVNEGQKEETTESRRRKLPAKAGV